MRISDWSSDVSSSDLEAYFEVPGPAEGKVSPGKATLGDGRVLVFAVTKVTPGDPKEASEQERAALQQQLAQVAGSEDADGMLKALRKRMKITVAESRRSEEHTSELQSLMRISYAVFCLKKKKTNNQKHKDDTSRRI